MKRLMITALVLFTFYIVKAQQISTLDGPRLRQLSVTYSVEINKAADIAAALDHNLDSIRAVVGKRKLTPAARLELINRLENDRQAAIRAVLTLDQYAELKAREAELATERRAAGDQYLRNQVRKTKERIVLQGETK
ncbi:hypothetical protein FAZ15_16330 [Sphingobacterium olei]|uniref:Uncharacterized protein n=1 Tax=Sphingobacterium olei TaxID=2571155 RepID=A0A4U0NHM8_9SPHI|nr:hypothetical protein [Sphingobacterium olei]TJZ53600.1 hypothetical protein FAZ15_16330 [Sphingobacterium olei]